MHSRNIHQQGYDFSALCQCNPELSPFVRDNGYGRLSIEFANPQAVLQLNKALLHHHYGIKYWQLPAGYLCPAVPGRVDYLHHLADLLTETAGKPCRGNKVCLLDIGCGANLIYPLLAQSSYGWRVVAADIDETSVKAAQQLVNLNQLQSRIEIRQQHQPAHIFQHLIQAGELFDLTMCNPPFHASAEVAAAGTARKQRQLGLSGDGLNFAGREHELICEGGELAFIQRMIAESQNFTQQVLWFSSLVSKAEHLPQLTALLNKAQASQRVITMQQGQKHSHILAWSWQSPAQQKIWCQYRLK